MNHATRSRIEPGTDETEEKRQALAACSGDRRAELLGESGDGTHAHPRSPATSRSPSFVSFSALDVETPLDAVDRFAAHAR